MPPRGQQGASKKAVPPGDPMESSPPSAPCSCPSPRNGSSCLKLTLSRWGPSAGRMHRRAGEEACGWRACWLALLLCAFNPIKVGFKARTVVWAQAVPGLHPIG